MVFKFKLIFLFLSVLHFTKASGSDSEQEVTTMTPDPDQNQDQEWTQTFESPDKNYTLKWSLDDTEWLLVEMAALTKGYVAMGLSPDGKMNGSDIVMGWVDSEGKAHIKDLYGVGNTKPKEDPEQNVEILAGHETDSQTIIRFRRRWNSCDAEHDRRVDEPHRIIWAYNEKDPRLVDEDGVFRPPYHFATRGAAAEDIKIDVPVNYMIEDCPDKVVKKRAAPSLAAKYGL